MFRPSQRSQRFRRSAILALLALLVVGLGLPRLLLVCKERCCDGRVALSRSCGDRERASARQTSDAPEHGCACCRAAHGPHASQRPARARLDQLGDGSGACGGCAHHALGCELGLPEAGDAPDLPTDAPCHLATIALQRARTHGNGIDHPPSTGPPRVDRRTGLLATTVLRI